MALMKGKAGKIEKELNDARGAVGKAEMALAEFDPFAGDVETAARARREVIERVELARERVRVLEDRLAAELYAVDMARVTELRARARVLEDRAQHERQEIERKLRDLLAPHYFEAPNHGRNAAAFGKAPLATQLERDQLIAEARRLEERHADRTATMARQKASGRNEALGRLLAGHGQPGDGNQAKLAAWVCRCRVVPLTEVRNTYAGRAPSAQDAIACFQSNGGVGVVGDNGAVFGLVPADRTPIAFNASEPIERAKLSDLPPGLRAVAQQAVSVGAWAD